MQNAEFKRATLEPVLESFGIEGELMEIGQWTDGHINRTYLADVRQGDVRNRYVIQRVNSRVFANIDGLMENAIRVSEHASRKLETLPGLTADALERGAIRFKRTLEGSPSHPAPEGDVWRLYPCIERARAYRVATSPESAYEAASAFGLFLRLVADLPGGRLNETLPDFHNTPQRFGHLADAAAADSLGRGAEIGAELAEMLERRPRASVLLDAHDGGAIPERIVHNDAKLSNVLLDLETRKAVCVIDLDTVMPGFAHYDFGDLVRSISNPADEAEEDLSKVEVRLEFFEALVAGFLDSAGEVLTRDEVEYLPEAGWVLTMEVAIRFMTDHLLGDKYFRIHHPGQNLTRARSQFALAKRIEEAMPELRRIVRKAYPAQFAR